MHKAMSDNYRRKSFIEPRLSVSSTTAIIYIVYTVIDIEIQSSKNTIWKENTAQTKVVVNYYNYTMTITILRM